MWLDSVNSKFLKVSFSRILSRFCVLRCFFAKRDIPLSPLSPAPKKPPLFLLRFACKPSARQTGRVPRFSASSAIERWYALTRYTLIGFLRCKNGRIYCHRFCLGIVLAHALLLILGKASHKFFEVVDSVNCLDSESSELVSKILLL